LLGCAAGRVAGAVMRLASAFLIREVLERDVSVTDTAGVFRRSAVSSCPRDVL